MKLYERINEGNWSPRGWKRGDKYCLANHAVQIYGETWVRVGPEKAIWPLIATAIELLYPGRCVYGAIGDFNDHPETTLEDVLRVCKLADV